MLEQVEIGGNIVAELIEKGAATLQLRSTKPHKKKSACNNAMATCDVPPSKGGILRSSCIVQTSQPSLPFIEKVASFF
jgi:hypothetical protein